MPRRHCHCIGIHFLNGNIVSYSSLQTFVHKESLWIYEFMRFKFFFEKYEILSIKKNNYVLLKKEEKKRYSSKRMFRHSPIWHFWPIDGSVVHRYQNIVHITCLVMTWHNFFFLIWRTTMHFLSRSFNKFSLIHSRNRIENAIFDLFSMNFW